MKSAIHKVEIANKHDAQDVLALLDYSFRDIQRQAASSREVTLWDWKYANSIFGPATVHVARAEKAIIATGASWPMRLTWLGRQFNALQTCDLAVHPDFRRQGLFAQLDKARKENAKRLKVDFLFSFPNANSLPGYAKFGWVHLGSVPWVVRVLKPWAVIRDFRRGAKSINLLMPARYRLCAVIATTLSLGRFPEQEGISLFRPQGYWQWRFVDHPSRQYGVVRSEDKADDFALFTLSKKDSGLVEMVVVDFISARDRIAGLLRAIVRCAQDLDAGFIAMMKPKGFPSSTFCKYFFFPVRQKNLAFWPVHSDLPQGLTDIRNWNFRTAMHDSI